jgi:LmbE family N-acetylglucosaminyl deacetylase
MGPTRERLALAVSPHPDDELIPVGGTLMILADAGWRVVNLACSLGRPGQHERRRDELSHACAVAGFELDVPDEPIAMSRGDDTQLASSQTRALVRGRLARYRPTVVLAPGPTDGHPAHELVSGAVSLAVADLGRPQPVWFWELWGHLYRATLLVRVDHVLDRVCRALEAHESEAARNDFIRLVRSRAAVSSVTGPERVFGFGVGGVPYDAAEVLCETIFAERGWRFGPPRELDPASPDVADAGVGEAGPFLAGRLGD